MKKRQAKKYLRSGLIFCNGCGCYVPRHSKLQLIHEKLCPDNYNGGRESVYEPYSSGYSQMSDLEMAARSAGML